MRARRKRKMRRKRESARDGAMERWRDGERQRQQRRGTLRTRRMTIAGLKTTPYEWGAFCWNTA